MNLTIRICLHETNSLFNISHKSRPFQRSTICLTHSVHISHYSITASRNETKVKRVFITRSLHQFSQPTAVARQTAWRIQREITTTHRFNFKSQPRYGYTLASEHLARFETSPATIGGGGFVDGSSPYVRRYVHTHIFRHGSSHNPYVYDDDGINERAIPGHRSMGAKICRKLVLRRERWGGWVGKTGLGKNVFPA